MNSWYSFGSRMSTSKITYAAIVSSSIAPFDTAQLLFRRLTCALCRAEEGAGAPPAGVGHERAVRRHDAKHLVGVVHAKYPAHPPTDTARHRHGTYLRL